MTDASSLLSAMSQKHRATTRRWLALAAAAAVSTAHLAIAAPPTALRQDGPWIFGERSDESTHRREQMAATPSAEDTDVWLLIVCNDVGITASLMHSTGFPSGIPAAPRLVLRSDGF